MEGEKNISEPQTGGDTDFVMPLYEAFVALKEAVGQIHNQLNDLCERFDDFEKNGGGAISEWGQFRDGMQKMHKDGMRKSWRETHSSNPDFQEASEYWKATGEEGDFGDEIYQLLEQAEEEAYKALQEAQAHDENYEGGEQSEFNRDEWTVDKIKKFIEPIRALRALKPSGTSAVETVEIKPETEKEEPAQKKEDRNIDAENQGRKIARSYLDRNKK